MQQLGEEMLQRLIGKKIIFLLSGSTVGCSKTGFVSKKAEEKTFFNALLLAKIV